MTGEHKALEIYLRLLAEEASESLAREQIAEQFVEAARQLDPEIVRDLLNADSMRHFDAATIPDLNADASAADHIARARPANPYGSTSGQQPAKPRAPWDPN